MSVNLIIHAINDKVEDIDISNELNDRFCAIPGELAAAFGEEDEGDENYMQIDEIPDGFKFRKITYKDVLMVLMETKTTKASGLDGLTARLLKLGGGS